MFKKISICKMLVGLCLLILAVYFTDMGFAKESLTEQDDLFRSAYSQSEVDQCAECIKKGNCIYPLDARKEGIEGYVKLKCVIGENGKVLATEIVEAVPEGVFEESVLAMVKGSKFRPAMKDGKKVASVIKNKINFTLP